NRLASEAKSFAIGGVRYDRPNLPTPALTNLPALAKLTHPTSMGRRPVSVACQSSGGQSRSTVHQGTDTRVRVKSSAWTAPVRSWLVMRFVSRDIRRAKCHQRSAFECRRAQKYSILVVGYEIL